MKNFAREKNHFKGRSESPQKYQKNSVPKPSQLIHRKNADIFCTFPLKSFFYFNFFQFF
jgi:hypothetical protein